MTPRGAVIYVRVSDESQAQTDTDGGYSLSVQKQLSRLKATDLGATFTKVYVEPGHTATTMLEFPRQVRQGLLSVDHAAVDAA